MIHYSYRKLKVWQKAQNLAVHIIKQLDTLSNTWRNQILGKQLLRSVTSISANIAEGNGRHSGKSYQYFLSIARGSATETDSWLDLFHRLALMNTSTYHDLHTQCQEIIAMLTSLINKAEASPKI